MTFAEFERTPDDPAGLRQELRHGEVVTLPPPKHRHLLVQRRLRRLLEAAAGESGEAEIEVGYRPVPEYEYWEADVVYVSRARWDAVSPEGNIQGPPELVVEVL